MRPVSREKSPKSGISSSMLTYIEQIENIDSINSQHESEILIDNFDLFINQKKSRRGHLIICGASA